MLWLMLYFYTSIDLSLILPGPVGFYVWALTMNYSLCLWVWEPQEIVMNLWDESRNRRIVFLFPMVFLS